jgi:retinol dehydrogenase-12
MLEAGMSAPRDLENKTFLVTGANSGIGKVTAIELAKRGADVVLAARSEEKTRPVLENIASSGGRAEFLHMDLGDLRQTKDAAKRFLDGGKPLHVLINNAGVAGQRGQTKDGFELAFGTNHLGHFLLTHLLLPRLRESTPARIVNVSSKSHYRAKGIPWDTLRQPTASITGMPEYEVSKLANVLFTKSLAKGRAGSGITSYALHPGVVATDAWRRIPKPFSSLIKLFMISEAEGALTTLHCATSPDVASEDGLYYDSCRERTPSRPARDEALAEELWKKSEEFLGELMK